MNYTDIDGALLLALKALLEERNVTRAAARLGISQPALSGRLGRLRTILGDPLFVPAANGRGVVPTPRAEALEQELLQVLEGLKRLASQPEHFDPATTTRTFVVAWFDTPAAVLAPGLCARLASEAPHARLACIHPPGDVFEQLEKGQIDLLVTVPDNLPGDIMQRPLWEDGFLTAQRKGHPRGSGPLDLDSFCALEHLIVSSQGGRFAGVVDDSLLRLGRSRRVSASIQSYLLAPLVLAATDALCTLPARFLRQFGDSLDLFRPPLELSTLRLALVWHPRTHKDAGHLWLRRQLYLAAELES
ncbi:LysR family transcriptional regulator [Metapseudomonas lalkuanensis]|uniref:LysR family transcriptional regulator n=1 Tax=Metapseudomonas lalkuanensis TaxID=2604832 RepID=A0A5J6QL48_9GAMM|nr:LysR family transcriptional regulator [Pseudomonas lalkuanensis]QEY63234.1 LysR family transcriptional regulator [Pseudomonas lalkuanensis]